MYVPLRRRGTRAGALSCEVLRDVTPTLWYRSQANEGIRSRHHPAPPEGSWLGEEYATPQPREDVSSCRRGVTGCRRMSPECREMSRKRHRNVARCRESVAGCRRNVARCRRNVTEMSRDVADVSQASRKCRRMSSYVAMSRIHYTCTVNRNDVVTVNQCRNGVVVTTTLLRRYYDVVVVS